MKEYLIKKLGGYTNQDLISYEKESYDNLLSELNSWVTVDSTMSSSTVGMYGWRVSDILSIIKKGNK